MAGGMIAQRADGFLIARLDLPEHVENDRPECSCVFLLVRAEAGEHRRMSVEGEFLLCLLIRDGVVEGAYARASTEAYDSHRKRSTLTRTFLGGPGICTEKHEDRPRGWQSGNWDTTRNPASHRALGMIPNIPKHLCTSFPKISLVPGSSTYC